MKTLLIASFILSLTSGCVSTPSETVESHQLEKNKPAEVVKSETEKAREQAKKETKKKSKVCKSRSRGLGSNLGKNRC